MKKTRKIVIRHLSRNKKHEVDPQTPTLFGFIETFVMGLLLATRHGAKFFVRIVSSPQPRGVRTANIIRFAVGLFQNKGDGLDSLIEIETDGGLNDFSSDERFKACKDEFKAVKARGAAVESEQVLFLTDEGGDLTKLRLTKLGEAVSVIDEIDDEGDVLIGGLHGCTIDGLHAHYAQQLNADTPNGMAAFGRQMDKCEGFVLTYEDGVLKSLVKVERPSWLNAMAFLVK